MTRRLLPLVLLAALVLPGRAEAITVDSTAYCLQGRMADGHGVYWGAVASNRHPLGTLIRMHWPINGKRWFRIRDRIGRGSSLDVWMPSCRAAIRYGRRPASYSVMGR